jgi:hypothetical protein
MDRKSFKVLCESWRKQINEDDMTGPPDLSASLEDDYLNSPESPDDFDMDGDDFGDRDKESLLDEFCKRMGIDRDALEGFLEDQAVEGDLEGNHFDRYGDEVMDPEDDIEH